MTLPVPAIIHEAAARFGLDPASPAHRRTAANIIYDCTRQGRPCILRLTDGAARNRNSILGEMHFLAHLAGQGAQVAGPLYALSGQLVETVEADGEAYHAAVFLKMPGTHPEGAAVSDAVLWLWGAALGQIHRLGKSYAPPSPELRRPHWHAMDTFQLEAYIPAEQALVRAQCRAVLDALHALPLDPDGYGLIHADPEPFNFLLHEGQVAFIDFDDCCYHWFAFDLAVALMYAVLVTDSAGDADRVRHLWAALLQGYREQNTLSDFWLRQIPLFLRLRALEDYAFTLRVWGGDAQNEEMQGFLAMLRQCIETDTLVVPFNLAGNT